MTILLKNDKYSSTVFLTAFPNMKRKLLLILTQNDITLLLRHKIVYRRVETSNRNEPWEYDKEVYKGRNVIEHNFRFIKQLGKSRW